LTSLFVAVASDIGAANAVAPVLGALRGRGHTVRLFASEGGKASQRFAELGLEFELAGESAVLPDGASALISGISVPRLAEEVLAQQAYKRYVPLVCIEDLWGGHSRCTTPPALVLTVDDHGVSLVGARWPAVRACAVGFAGLFPLQPRAHVAEAFAEYRKRHGVKVVMFTDARVLYEPGLRLLMESVLASKGRWHLLPSFHPRHRELLVPGTTSSLVGHWQNILMPLRRRGLVCNIDATGDEAAMLCDATASSFSSLLLRAALSGRKLFVVDTPEARANLLSGSNLSRNPLIAGGETPLTVPADLSTLPASAGYRPHPIDAKRCADEVLSIL